MIGADERLIEKMIQAKLFGGECGRDRLLARGPSTTPEDRSAHGTPHVAIPKTIAGEPTTIFRAWRKYPVHVVSNIAVVP